MERREAPLGQRRLAAHVQSPAFCTSGCCPQPWLLVPGGGRRLTQPWRCWEPWARASAMRTAGWGWASRHVSHPHANGPEEEEEQCRGLAEPTATAVPTELHKLQGKKSLDRALLCGYEARASCRRAGSESGRGSGESASLLSSQ